MDSISFKPAGLVNPFSGAGSVTNSAKSGFGEALQKALDGVNAQQNHAEALTKEFQLENPAVSLEETMVAMQKASISFQAAVQVRNKLISAYHDIMNMPV